MKATISAICIIATIILMCILTRGYTNSVCNETRTLLEQCAASAENEDWIAAQSLFDEADSRFAKAAPILKMYIPHEDLGDVYEILLRIEAAIALRDTETCTIEINCLSGYLDVLSATDTLTAQNLF